MRILLRDHCISSQIPKKHIALCIGWWGSHIKVFNLTLMDNTTYTQSGYSINLLSKHIINNAHDLVNNKITTHSLHGFATDQEYVDQYKP